MDYLVTCSPENYVSDNTFKDGNDLKQLVSPDPHFQVISYNNPGVSSYCLKQTENIDSGVKNSYQLDIPVEPGHQYMFQIWLSHDNNWNSNISPFTISYDTKITTQSNLSYKIKNKVRLGNKTCKDWELYEAVLDIPLDANPTISWKLGYPANQTKGLGYWCNPIVKRFRPSLRDFDVTRGLQSFVVAYHPLSYNENNSFTLKTWKDLSGEGNDYYWDSVPTFNSRTGFSMSGNTLTGDICSKIGLGTSVNSPFTIGFICNIVNSDTNYNTFLKLYGEPVSSSSDIISSDALTINFNNQYMQITHSQNTPIVVNCGLTNIPSCYFIVNTSSGKILVYKDAQLLYSSGENWLTPYTWSATKKITINPTSQLVGTLSSLLMYNQELCDKDIEYIKIYLLNNINYIKQKKIEDQHCDLEDENGVSVSPSLSDSVSSTQNLSTKYEGLTLEELKMKLIDLKENMKNNIDPIFKRIFYLKNKMVTSEDSSANDELLSLQIKQKKLLSDYKIELETIHKKMLVLQLRNGPVVSEEQSNFYSNDTNVKCSVCFGEGNTRFNYDVKGGNINFAGVGLKNDYMSSCPEPLSRYGVGAMKCNSVSTYPQLPDVPTVDYDNASITELKNQPDNNLFIRSLRQEPDAPCFNSKPDPKKWIRKDSIPCWGCNLDD